MIFFITEAFDSRLFAELRRAFRAFFSSAAAVTLDSPCCAFSHFFIFADYDYFSIFIITLHILVIAYAIDSR